MWQQAGDEDLTWERDDEHFPAALPPLVIDYVRLGLSAGWEAAYANRELPARPRYRVLNGYAYTGIRLLSTATGAPSVAEVVARRNREAATDLRRRWTHEILPRLKAIYRRIDEPTVESRPIAQLAQTWDDAWRESLEVWTLHFTVDGPAYRSLTDLVEIWKALLPERPESDALRVLHSPPGAMGALRRDLARLETLARASPAAWQAVSVDPRRVLDRRADGSSEDGLLRALRVFIGRHGHLGQAHLDPRLPTWGDEPERLIEILAQRISSPADGESHQALVARLGREADELWRQARASLRRRGDVARLNEVIRRARRVGWLTQEHSYWIDQMHGALMGRFERLVGRRLRDLAVIDTADDVFFLQADEVVNLLRTPVGRHELVAARRAELEHFERLRPPHLLGRLPAHEGTAGDGAADGVRLGGEPASPGLGRGPARLIRSADDLSLIRAGEVIVSRGANPSWVPSLSMAAGLVVQGAGTLSHAAILARELGLPAVTGIADALELIADGQLLEVDGTAGVVTIRPR